MLTALCVAGFTLLAQQWRSDEAGPGPGDCYAVVAHRKSVDFQETDCAARDASYKVALTVDSPDWSMSPGSCPDGSYRALRPGTGDTLCLMLTVQVGDCVTLVRPPVGTDSGELARDVCRSASQSKVTKIFLGHRESCGPGETATSYSQPATIICLGKP
ncbi:MAG TPA: hypothetical protein VF821_04770 [Lentzea sp.]